MAKHVIILNLTEQEEAALEKCFEAMEFNLGLDVYVEQFILARIKEGEKEIVVEAALAKLSDDEVTNLGLTRRAH